MGTAAIHRLSPQEVSRAIITAAMSVHSEWGPGLPESAWQACLHHELQQAEAFCEWPGVEEKRNLYPLRTRRFHEGNLGAILGSGL
jgi:hypothetical protein